jgi:general secretion pathway protein I
LRQRPGRGFTLIEVMVALAIVSIGLIAVFNAIIQMAHSTSVLRERAMADWIAMNEISAIRIAGNFPDVGNFDGTTEFAGREWRWEAEISETGVSDLRRIEMTVAYEDRPDDSITIMTGFVSRATGIGLQVDWWGAAAPGAPAGEEQDVEPPEDDDPPRGRPPRRERPVNEDDGE